MKKILITGFEPFGGENTNPSYDAICRLPDEVGAYALSRLCLPVVFGEAARVVIEEAERLMPDVILCIGQAGGRSAITPELVAINLRYAKIPDNEGNRPKDEKIDEYGECAYFSSLPVRRIAQRINESGLPCELSYSAGAYVCNDLYYTLLSKYKNTHTRVGFIHVPYSKEQGKEPSMELSDIVKGLRVAIESLDS